MADKIPDTRDKFVWDSQTMSSIISQCFYCKHYTGKGACEAFPSGIPDPILANVYDHKVPFPGDNGIRYEYMPPPQKGDGGKE